MFGAVVVFEMVAIPLLIRSGLLENLAAGGQFAGSDPDLNQALPRD